MKKLLILVFLVGFCFGQTAVDDYGICKKIRINYERNAMYTYDINKNKLEYKEGKENMSITIGGLDTEHPVMYGNMGDTSQLIYFGGDFDIFYLMEITAGGRVFMTAIFPQDKKASLTKQNKVRIGNRVIMDPYATMLFGSYSCIN
jgi:hypothetical protein